jgi:S-adenosylmethionine-dependent methyltransferase
LATLHAGEKLDVWDAGCGLGQMSLWFAQGGHNVVCCDISYKMLAKSKERFAQASLMATFHQASAQEMATLLPHQDLVLFHAVLEWLANPLETLNEVSNRVKEGGYLSLLFFNYNSIIFRNTLRGGWRLETLLTKSWYGKGKKLTPPHPQRPEIILDWLQSHGYTIYAHTGIRVFHDYMDEHTLEETKTEDLMKLEYQYCREKTFRDMARYVHILARKDNLSIKHKK